MNSIKINGTGDLEAIQAHRQAENKRLTEDKKFDTPNPTAFVANDTIEVSERVAKVNQLVEEINKIPEIRTEQVSPLGEAIQNGQYNPSAQKIADAILKNE
jgi:flagellar biosynthesis anti-sigma factor FlgM